MFPILSNTSNVTLSSLIDSAKMICSSIAMTIGLLIHMAKIKCTIVKNELVFWFNLFYHNDKRIQQEHRSVFTVNMKTFQVMCKSTICIILPHDVIRMMQNFTHWFVNHPATSLKKSWERAFEYQN